MKVAETYVIQTASWLGPIINLAHTSSPMLINIILFVICTTGSQTQLNMCISLEKRTRTWATDDDIYDKMF